jgi:TRAP-type C4-dicarboxylate transport system permease small subunit
MTLQAPPTFWHNVRRPEWKRRFLLVLLAVILLGSVHAVRFFEEKGIFTALLLSAFLVYVADLAAVAIFPREPVREIPAEADGPAGPSAAPTIKPRRRLLEKVTRVLDIVLMVGGGVAVLGVMVLASVNVLLRYCSIPFSGAYELAGYLGAVVIAFALGYTQHTKGNIIVDILTDKYPPWLGQILDAFAYLVTAVFFAVVAWNIFGLTAGNCRTCEVSETLKIVFYPFIFCVGLGFASLSLNLVNDLVRALTRKRQEAKP